MEIRSLAHSLGRQEIITRMWYYSVSIVYIFKINFHLLFSILVFHLKLYSEFLLLGYLSFKNEVTEIISAPTTLAQHKSRHGNQGLVSRNIVFLFLVPTIKGLPRFVQDPAGHKHTALTFLQDKNKHVHIWTELPHRPHRLRLVCHSLSSIHDLNPFFPTDPMLVVWRHHGWSCYSINTLGCQVNKPRVQ